MRVAKSQKPRHALIGRWVILPTGPTPQRYHFSTGLRRSEEQGKEQHGTTTPSAQSRTPSPAPSSVKDSHRPDTPPSDWDENPNYSISAFSELPSNNFGVNQHMIINAEFKEALRQILWQFRAPIRYAFAYGSGVFPQSAQGSGGSASKTHPHPSAAISTVQGEKGKMIDFIFGVSFTQHWHSLNLQQHRDHYSGVRTLGSYVVSQIQDRFGAGVYFNPYVTVNGTLIKYGVVNLDTLCNDLSEWSTLYLAGRLQKPVKILRDDPRVRLANQVNLLSAVRTALLLLPEKFTEHELYSAITGISYMGDPRMALPTENPQKVQNIVTHQIPNFRRLYVPLIDNLPNVAYNDSRTSDPSWLDDDTSDIKLEQDMDPKRRGNMVRRLPKAFRERLYFAYQSKFQIPQLEFNKMLEESQDEDSKGLRRREGGPFEQRLASDDPASLKREVTQTIRKTIGWPSTVQTIKGPVTSGFARSWRYMREKREKYAEGQAKEREARQAQAAKDAKLEKSDPASKTRKGESEKELQSEGKV